MEVGDGTVLVGAGRGIWSVLEWERARLDSEDEAVSESVYNYFHKEKRKESH